MSIQELIDDLNTVQDKSLPIKFITMLPEYYANDQLNTDNAELIVDDDGDEVMLTLDLSDIKVLGS